MKPDLLTPEGRLAYLDYHAPDGPTAAKHRAVNEATQIYWQALEQLLPDGPGKTRALHQVNHGRMECNNAIANEGA